MMEINLLPQRQVLSHKEKLLRRRLTAAVIFTTVLFSSAALLCYGAYNYGEYRFWQVQKEREVLFKERENYKETAQNLAAIHGKIEGLTFIKANPRRFGETLKAVDSLLGEKLKLVRLAVEQSGKITLTVKAGDIESLSALLERLAPTESGLAAEDETTPFTAAVLSGLRQEADGGFSFTVEMEKKIERREQ